MPFALLAYERPIVMAFLSVFDPDRTLFYSAGVVASQMPVQGFSLILQGSPHPGLVKGQTSIPWPGMCPLFPQLLEPTDSLDREYRPRPLPPHRCPLQWYYRSVHIPQPVQGCRVQEEEEPGVFSDRVTHLIARPRGLVAVRCPLQCFKSALPRGAVAREWAQRGGMINKSGETSEDPALHQGHPHPSCTRFSLGDTQGRGGGWERASPAQYWSPERVCDRCR